MDGTSDPARSSGDGGNASRPSRDGLSRAARTVGGAILLGVVPVLAIVLAFDVALTGQIAADFHNELYPQAEVVLSGDDPYHQTTPTATAPGYLVWPPLAVAFAAPFTLLAPAEADLLAAVASLLCMVAALLVMGVRDYRVVGAVLLWPSVLAEVQTAHLTLVLCLLLALTVRLSERDDPTAGIVLGAACGLKLLLWPVGLWLASIGRVRAAVVAALVALASIAVVEVYSDLGRYVRLVRLVVDTFDQDALTPFGLLSQLGLADAPARAVGIVLGVALAVLAWRLRSLALWLAVALVLSPIVWLDYFALLAIPLARVQPRLSWIWLLPLLTWGVKGAGLGSASADDTARILAIFAVVVGVTVHGERSRERREAAQRAAALSPA